jgi:hypothetical protein
VYAQDELTVERAEAFKAALEAEQVGYEARLEAKKNGRPSGIGSDLSEEQLADRIKQVDEQIKRVNADISEAKKPKEKKGKDAS